MPVCVSSDAGGTSSLYLLFPLLPHPHLPCRQYVCFCGMSLASQNPKSSREVIDLVVGLPSGESTRRWGLWCERSRLLRYGHRQISFSICRSRRCSWWCRRVRSSESLFSVLHLVMRRWSCGEVLEAFCVPRLGVSSSVPVLPPLNRGFVGY